jgi:hypothetical protein
MNWWPSIKSNWTKLPKPALQAIHGGILFRIMYLKKYLKKNVEAQFQFVLKKDFKL